MLMLRLLWVMSAQPIEVPPNLDSAIAASKFIHGAPAHGTPGPWVLTGFRLGRDALQRVGLQRSQAFEIEVVHRTLMQVRYTCMVDGVMAATGVSPGKMNVSLESVPSEDDMETVVTHRKTGRQWVYRMLPAFRDKIRSIDYAQFPQTAKWLESVPFQDMFIVTSTTLSPSKSP